MISKTGDAARTATIVATTLIFVGLVFYIVLNLMIEDTAPATTPDMTEYWAPQSTAMESSTSIKLATKVAVQEDYIARLEATAYAVPKTIIREVIVTPTPSWGMEVYEIGEDGYATSFGDGIWIVGVEVGPGLYRNHGAKIMQGTEFRADTLSWCRWSLHMQWSMRYDTDRIAQAYDVYNVVEITWKDKLFQSHNCGVWEKVKYP